MGRRSRRLLFGGALVGAILLLGRGLGLLPTAPISPPPAGTAPKAAAPTPAPPPVGGQTPGIDEDRLQRALSGGRAALLDGRLGGGFLDLDELLGSELSPGQRAAVESSRQQLELALAASCGELAQQLQGGRLLRARAILGALLQRPHVAVTAALAALAQQHGWPALAADAAGDDYVPEPVALPAGRAVRAQHRGQEVEAPVVDATPAEVTLRLHGQGGVTFPSLPVVQVEPLQPTAGEAAELGLAALRARDGLMARLWLCFAIEHGGGGRTAELRQLLAK